MRRSLGAIVFALALFVPALARALTMPPAPDRYLIGNQRVPPAWMPPRAGAVVSQNAPTVVSTPAKFGGGLSFVGSSREIIHWPEATYAGYRAGTVVVGISGLTDINYLSIWEQTDGTGSSGVLIQMFTGGRAGNLGVRIIDNRQDGFDFWSAARIIDGQPHVLAIDFTHDGADPGTGTATLWVDGVLDTHQTVGFMHPIAQVNSTAIGGDWENNTTEVNGGFFTGTISFVFEYDRILSAAEHAALAVNPLLWQAGRSCAVGQGVTLMRPPLSQVVATASLTALSLAGPAVAQTQWGGVGDIAVPADYDGDRKVDVAVYRSTTGLWYIQRSSDGGTTQVQWGQPGDQPVPADYDGDGKTDIAVYRPTTGTWYIIRSSDGVEEQFAWGGVNGDVPVPCDYNGDGVTDLGIFRPSTGEWFIQSMSRP